MAQQSAWSQVEHAGQLSPACDVSAGAWQKAQRRPMQFAGTGDARGSSGEAAMAIQDAISRPLAGSSFALGHIAPPHAFDFFADDLSDGRRSLPRLR